MILSVRRRFRPMLFRVGFVALFVVACGFLLMLGGAISLLLGFDIVLTERGSAMTIGGVIALSGGVIAIGIGFALKRLNQILRTLEGRAGKPARSEKPGRPVLPISTEAQSRSMDAPPLAAALTEQQRPEPAIPPDAIPATVTPPPMPPVVPPVFSPRPPVGPASGLAAGALLGAGIGATSTYFGRSDGSARASAAGAEPSSANVGGLDASADEPLVEEAMPGPAAGVGEPVASLPQDLEEELSRALAETSILPDPQEDFSAALQPELQPEEPVQSPQSSQDDDRSFEDGLSQLLGRRARTPVPPADVAPHQDLADLIYGSDVRPSVGGPSLEASTAAGLSPEVLAEEQPLSASEAGPSVAAGLSGETSPVNAEERDVDSLFAPIEEPSAQSEEPSVGNSWQDIINREPERDAPMPAPDFSPDPAEITSNDGLAEQESVQGASQDLGSQEVSSGARDLGSDGPVGNDASAPRPAPLGTYTIDGRTYSMFADGSVEAVNALGEVERFASMNELRRHLAGA